MDFLEHQARPSGRSRRHHGCRRFPGQRRIRNGYRHVAHGGRRLDRRMKDVKMAMKGFDPKFKDLPDFIIGITKEIWEDRGIATLHNYYGEDMAVRSPASVVVGNRNVISATM